MSLSNITFGPVPSRRLGRSLGINNIPPKVCSYSCIYCQAGRTDTIQITRQPFYDPQTILTDVKRKISEVMELGESIDFLAFVPDGEPTLDIKLGRTIDLLRPMGVNIAVISNGSLLWQESVRNDLAKADWVSLKIDSVTKEIWRYINRPHRDLDLSIVLEAMLQFAREYEGKLVTETMLVHGVNDSPRTLTEVADFLARLKPAKAYLSIPTRPPTETWVHPPAENVMNMAYQIVSQQVNNVECLFGYEGNAFSLTGDIEEELLNIIAVHPMQEEAVQAFLVKAGVDWQLIDKLITRDRIFATVYQGKKFYLRKLKRTDG
ncbi:MAG: radical SAM protein [Proteobacteria bacterium]|nr:radical SAM protein [Pseudomonadota bacterium]MBU1649587.1 radical SAM protein [Pseudomonadota bacterium]MBU1986730.1 radical SAM protein [Pseudomonadota bacterium]